MPLPALPLDMRVEKPEDYTLENEHLLARFDPLTCALVSLLDKRGGEELVAATRPADFRYILEDDLLGMTAWIVGRYMHDRPFAESARLLRHERGVLRQELAYEMTAGASRLTVTISLEAGSRRLDYAVECDWHEIGRKAQGVPRLSFRLPLTFACAGYQYDIPFGSITRSPLEHDVPANSWAFARRLGQGQASLQLVSRFGYGFRGVGDSLALTLLRSSYDPDPYPEVGLHAIQFAVCLADANAAPGELARAAFAVQHPFNVVSGSASQPAQTSFLTIESGSVVLSALKLPEDDPSGSSLLLRCYEMDGKDTQAVLRFSQRVKGAVLVDVHEQLIAGAPVPLVDGPRVSFPVGAYRIGTVKVEF